MELRRNKRSHLVRPPFPALNTHFLPTAGGPLSQDVTRCLLISGCGQGHDLLRMTEIPLGAVLSLTTDRTETGVRYEF